MIYDNTENVVTLTGPEAASNPSTLPPKRLPSGLLRITLIPPVRFSKLPLSVGMKEPDMHKMSKSP